MGLEAIGVQSNFSNIDWLIVGAYLLGSVAVGFYANRFVSDIVPYRRGGGRAGESKSVMSS